MKNYLFSALILLMSQFALAESPALQHASVGKVERLEIYSPEMGQMMFVDTWLPESYIKDGSRSFPVIYMHDGQNLYDAFTTWNHQSWEMDSVTQKCVDEGTVQAPIIVGIHSFSDTRIGDLMPQKVFESMDSASVYDSYGEVRGDRYGAFIVNTLKPAIDALYCTKPDRDNTFVMGSSMGGLMSFYLICEYPQIFGGAGCVSTHWPLFTDGNPRFGDSMLRYIGTNAPDPATHKLYFDHGTATIDALYGPWQEKVNKALEEKGYSESDNMKCIVIPGATHEERAWASRVDVPLRFLLAK